jgi:orotate phosphoribosyltransferase
VVRTLEEEIVRAGAFRLGDFTLASGRKSDFYIDLRMVITKPGFLKRVAQAMAPSAEDHDFIAGLELSAIPLATALSLETGKPFLMVRKTVKGHGTGRLVEGELKPGARVLFVEDTVTTAGTLVNGIKAVRELNGIVDKAIVVVDRKEGARENLAAIGVEMVSLASVGRLRELVQ